MTATRSQHLARTLAIVLGLLTPALLSSCTSNGSTTRPESLPATASPIKNHPLIFSYSNGHQVKLSPDTGAAQDLVLFKATAELLGLGTAAGPFMSSAPLKLTYSPNAEVGFDRAFVLDAPVSEFDGLIGWPEIQRGVWHLNLPARKHDFHWKLPERVRSYPSLPIIPGQSILKVRLPDGKEAVIDTGASRALHLSTKAFDNWIATHPQVPVTLYSGYSPAAKGGYFAKRCGRAATFDLGPIRLENVTIYETFAEVAAPGIRYNIELLFGLEAFAHRELWIDGPGGRVYFGPRRSSSWRAAPVSQVRAVFIPDKRTGKLSAHVLEGGAAHAAGLRDGDELLALNSKRFFSPDDLSRALSAPGTRTRVTINRNGQTRDFFWTVPKGF